MRFPHRVFNTASSMVKVTCFLLLSLMISGCASLLIGGAESPSRYTLEPLTETVQSPIKLNVRLIISDPTAEAAFATSKIAHSPAQLRYDYFTGGEWSDRAPRLFGIFLQRSFEDDGRIKTVGDRITIPVGDFILRTDIRKFNVETRGPERFARVSYSVMLSDRRNNVVDTKLFTAEEPVASVEIAGAVAALNSAANQAVQETVTWVVQTLQSEVN